MSNIPNPEAINASCRTPANPGPIPLRPDLAAFFALASREHAPHRLIHEHGVLAELHCQTGCD